MSSDTAIKNVWKRLQELATLVKLDEQNEDLSSSLSW